jgi:hypothetical protein
MEQPNADAQRELQSVELNLPDYVKVRGRKFKIKWMLNFTRSRITKVILTEGNDDKQSCMCAALMVLNSFWAIKLWYWLKWRWFYYVKQYNENELTELLNLGKKKVPLDEYYTNTILLTALKDTSMMMKKTEVATTLQGLNTEQPTKSQKTTAG